MKEKHFAGPSFLPFMQIRDLKDRGRLKRSLGQVFWVISALASKPSLTGFENLSGLPNSTEGTILRTLDLLSIAQVQRTGPPLEISNSL